MDIVRIVNAAIDIEDVFRESSVNVSSSVSLFVGRKQSFENNILWPESGVCDRQRTQVLLSRVCETVRSRKSVTRIAIYCRLLPSPDDPCIVIACSAVNYQQASKAVEETVQCIASLKVNYNTNLTSNVVKCVHLCEEGDDLASHMVQVRANSTEMRGRISAFIERKREQINNENVRDFCCHKIVPEDKNSCARVGAVSIHRKDSKGHIQVRRVFNSWGPQTRGSVMLSEGAEPYSFSTTKCQENVVGVEERLGNLEEHMGLLESSSPGDVHSRLKKVEDRILYLEGLSPEYAEFWGKISPTSPSRNEVTNSTKRMYAKDDVARKIKELQNKLALKQK